MKTTLIVIASLLIGFFAIMGIKFLIWVRSINKNGGL